MPHLKPFIFVKDSVPKNFVNTGKHVPNVMT